MYSHEPSWHISNELINALLMYSHILGQGVPQECGELGSSFAVFPHLKLK